MRQALWRVALVLAVLFGSYPATVPTAVADLPGPGSAHRTGGQVTRSESGHQPADPTCYASLGVTTDFSSTDASAVQQAIDAAATNDLVKVAGYCAGVSSRDSVTQTAFISKSLVIRGGYTNTNWIDFDPVGQPTTLDAQAGGRVLYLTADSHSTIEGLRITGGNAQVSNGGSDGNDGGGVYVITATVILSDSEVFGNTAGQGSDAVGSDNGGNGGSGGGVYNNGVLTITHSTLHDNRAGNGGSSSSGAPGAGGSGGSIYNNKSLSVLNSIVTNNEAGDGGASFFQPFNGYGPGGDGGGIYNNGRLFVGDSSLSLNRSGAGNRSGYGGGIFNHDIQTIMSSKLIDNATSDGLGTYHYGGDGGAGGGLYNDGNLSVIDSTLSGNRTGAGRIDLLSGFGGDGGGIYSSGTLTVINSVLQNNQTGEGGDTSNRATGGNGGGIYSSGSLTLINSTLHNNQTGGPSYSDAGAGGGGLAVVQGNAQLSQNIVISNTASYRGGGFYFSAGSVVLTNTLIADNFAAVTGSGLIAAQASVMMKHATVVSNTGGDGSGISIGDNSTADLINLIVAQHAVGITASITSTTHITGVLWFDNTMGNVGGPGDISVTSAFTGFPAFVDPLAGDFHLTAASAAINRGVNADVPIDLDGSGRDTAPDLGAYEYRWARRFYLTTLMRQ